MSSMTMPSTTMFQSFQGPTDTSLRMGPVRLPAQTARVTRVCIL
jgi:hypothetical protein